MARPKRSSKPGWLQHTVTRGIGRRPLFENAGDYLYFEKLMKRVFDREDRTASLFAYCLMPNHVHEITGGELDGISQAMQSQLQPYTQWFNRRRGRDGPLYSQRFFAAPVDMGRGLVQVVRYIDQNPVKAGLVAHAEDYAWQSAGGYLRDALPSWVDGSLVRQHLGRELAAGLTPAQAYLARFGGPMTSLQFRELEERIRKSSSGRKAAVAPPEYNSSDSLNWYEDRAQLADGMSLLGRRMITASDLDSLFISVMSDGDSAARSCRPLKGVGTYLELARFALLSCVCWLGVGEIAALKGVAGCTVSRRLKRHASLLNRDPDYRDYFLWLLGTLERATAWE